MMICGPSRFSTSDERAQRDHLALLVADLEPADVLGLEPEPLVGLDPDLVGPAELVEVVDVGRAERRLERAEDRRRAGRPGSWPSPGRRRRRAAGRPARKVVFSALQAGLGVAVADHLVGDLLELGRGPRRRGPRAGSGSRPATPRPWMAGGGKAKTIASRICCELARAGCRGSPPGSVPVLGPLLPGRQRDVEGRRVRGDRLVEHRLAADHDPAARRPGVFLRIASTLLDDRAASAPARRRRGAGCRRSRSPGPRSAGSRSAAG